MWHSTPCCNELYLSVAQHSVPLIVLSVAQHSVLFFLSMAQQSVP